MFADGKLAPRGRRAVGRGDRAALRDSTRPDLDGARFLVVEETGVGAEHPFSGEKLSPVLAFYRAPDFDAAAHARRANPALPGRGSFGRACIRAGPSARCELGLTLPVCRVIVNQAHCFATGGSFDNALPFSLSMGCGTWGGNSISDNLDYRHFLNITRVVHPLAPERVASRPRTSCSAITAAGIRA